MRHIPPPLWALLLLGATWGLSLAPGLRDWPVLQARPIGLSLIAVALAIVFFAIVQFRLANTQLLPESKSNNSLVTDGLYAFTRNPMYLAMTVFCLGGALWFGRLPMLLAPLMMFAIANWVFIPFEEEKMRRQFGAAFEGYCLRVRRWL